MWLLMEDGWRDKEPERDKRKGIEIKQMVFKLIDNEYNVILQCFAL